MGLTQSSGPKTTTGNFKAILSGRSEVPPRVTTATGEASFTVNSANNTVAFSIRVHNIRNVISATLNRGTSGTTGPVVAQLFGPVAPSGGKVSGALAAGSIEKSELEGPLAGKNISALVELLRSGRAYVNIATSDGSSPPNSGAGDFPAGEIRGQVIAATSAGVSACFGSDAGMLCA